MAGRPFTALILSLSLLSLFSPSRVSAADERSASILVDYPGSWELRYKVYFSEVGDSEEYRLSGIGRRKVQVRDAGQAVILCAWLDRSDTRRDADMSLRIVVRRGSERAVKSSPPTPGWLFTRRKSVCYHFR
jgi:hypothetical protein